MALTVEILKAHLEKTGLCAPNDRILLAVSGGMDSMALWHMLRSAGFTVGVAHMNFQLRGQEADADQAFVEETAASQGVPFFSKRAQTHAYAAAHKLSIEEAARDLRYAWLEDIRATNGYSLIATAHHGDDTAETLLLNLIRGTGIKGLAGIPAANELVIRPLLFTDRTTLLAYCETNAIPYRVDASNADTTFRRNYIRHNVVPVLRELNPSILHTLRDNATHFYEAGLLMEERAQTLLNRWQEKRAGDAYMPILRIRKHKAGKTLLYAWLSPYGFNSKQCDQIWEAAGKSGRQFYSDNFRLVTTTKHFIVTAPNTADLGLRMILPDERTLRYGSRSYTFEIISPSSGINLQTPPDTALFDAEKLQWPLVIRKWAKGDFMYPIGLEKSKSGKPGKKKVSDILVDLKLPIPGKRAHSRISFW